MDLDELRRTYDSGRCDVFTNDFAALAAQRTLLGNPRDHVILPERVSKEPLSPVVRQGDEELTNIVAWTVFALIDAEEMGITQASLPWHLRHHALFVCYGPVDNPRYACAVIVEHGQAGGATAGPIGRDVLVETMKRDPSRRTDRFRKMASR